MPQRTVRHGLLICFLLPFVGCGGGDADVSGGSGSSSSSKSRAGMRPSKALIGHWRGAANEATEYCFSQGGAGLKVEKKYDTGSVTNFGSWEVREENVITGTIKLRYVNDENEGTDVYVTLQLDGDRKQFLCDEGSDFPVNVLFHKVCVYVDGKTSF